MRADHDTTLADALRSNQPLAGPFVLFNSPGLVELLAHAGFDFVVIDYMHTSFSSETVEQLIRAADAVRLPALVRVPPADGRSITQVLEAGAAGVVVPHVGTRQDAERAVQAAKFPPIGGRGACPSVRAAAYQTRNEVEYQTDVNAKTLVVALIESLEGITNAPEIVAFEGIDAFLVGMYDLSCSIGHPGELGHPRVAELVEQFIGIAAAMGRRVGIHLFDPSDASHWRNRGITFFTLSLTSLVLRAARSAVQEVTGGRSI